MQREQREIRHLLGRILAAERSSRSVIERVNEGHRASARNLIHYLTLRRLDLRDLQMRLAHLGLSSLGRCESFVLDNVLQTLARLRGGACGIRDPYAALTWGEARSRLHASTRALLGRKPLRRHVYIMVTAPSRELATKEWAREAIRAGMNVLRINCAHGSPADWKEMAGTVRAAAHALGRECRILVDLEGPKLRVLAPEKRKLRPGDRFKIFLGSGRARGDDCIHVSHPEAFLSLRMGDRVLFDDGKAEARVVGRSGRGRGRLELEVVRVQKGKFKLRAEHGVNLPGVALPIAMPTESDLRNLRYVREFADMIGLSLVEKPRSLKRIRRALGPARARSLGLVLKIETEAGFRALPHLLLEAMRGAGGFGVMIARGDLAVEVGFERMAEIQQEILWLCEAPTHRSFGRLRYLKAWQRLGFLPG
ncbi:MAG: pyruvate kinase, partial [Calothrix sp. SM1_5_4]|nr:pyruvate kinase [Calothrix sp. SM1_5_4]